MKEKTSKTVNLLGWPVTLHTQWRPEFSEHLRDLNMLTFFLLPQHSFTSYCWWNLQMLLLKAQQISTQATPDVLILFKLEHLDRRSVYFPLRSEVAGWTWGFRTLREPVHHFPSATGISLVICWTDSWMTANTQLSQLSVPRRRRTRPVKTKAADSDQRAQPPVFNWTLHNKGRRIMSHPAQTWMSSLNNTSSPPAISGIISALGLNTLLFS